VLRNEATKAMAVIFCTVKNQLLAIVLYCSWPFQWLLKGLCCQMVHFTSQ